MEGDKNLEYLVLDAMRLVERTLFTRRTRPQFQSLVPKQLTPREAALKLFRQYEN